MIDPNLEAIAAEIIAVAVAAMVVFGFVTLVLLRAARLASAAMVTLALSLITILALAAYAVTREEVIAAIVGTGIGALAGAVTAQLGGATSQTKEEPKMTEQPDAVDGVVDEAADEPLEADAALDEAHDGAEFDAPDVKAHDDEATEASVSDGTGEPKEGA